MLASLDFSRAKRYRLLAFFFGVFLAGFFAGFFAARFRGLFAAFSALIVFGRAGRG